MKKLFFLIILFTIYFYLWFAIQYEIINEDDFNMALDKLDYNLKLWSPTDNKYTPIYLFNIITSWNIIDLYKQDLTFKKIFNFYRKWQKENIDKINKSIKETKIDMFFFKVYKQYQKFLTFKDIVLNQPTTIFYVIDQGYKINLPIVYKNFHFINWYFNNWKLEKFIFYKFFYKNKKCYLQTYIPQKGKSNKFLIIWWFTIYNSDYIFEMPDNIYANLIKKPITLALNIKSLKVYLQNQKQVDKKYCKTMFVNISVFDKKDIDPLKIIDNYLNIKQHRYLVFKQVDKNLNFDDYNFSTFKNYAELFWKYLNRNFFDTNYQVPLSLINTFKIKNLDCNLFFDRQSRYWISKCLKSQKGDILPENYFSFTKKLKNIFVTKWFSWYLQYLFKKYFEMYLNIDITKNINKQIMNNDYTQILIGRITNIFKQIGVYKNISLDDYIKKYNNFIFTKAKRSFWYCNILTNKRCCDTNVEFNIFIFKRFFNKITQKIADIYVYIKNWKIWHRLAIIKLKRWYIIIDSYAIPAYYRQEKFIIYVNDIDNFINILSNYYYLTKSQLEEIKKFINSNSKLKYKLFDFR